MQISRRALALCTSHVRLCSNTAQPLSAFIEKSETAPSTSSPIQSSIPSTSCNSNKLLVKQKVRLVEERVSIDGGLLVWTSQHKSGNDGPKEDEETESKKRGYISGLRYNVKWCSRCVLSSSPFKTDTNPDASLFAENIDKLSLFPYNNLSLNEYNHLRYF